MSIKDYLEYHIRKILIILFYWKKLGEWEDDKGNCTPSTYRDGRIFKLSALEGKFNYHYTQCSLDELLKNPKQYRHKNWGCKNK